jgi:hypothetical protein
MHLPVGSWRAGAGDRARLDRFRLRRGLDPGDRPAYAAARLRALDELDRRRRTAPPGPAWRPLGPFAIPHGRTAGSGPGSRPQVTGRVAAVAVDPGDPRHLLAGAGAGGVWESRDGGRSWRPRTDGQPSLAIGAVAFDPGNPAVAYAGTGQGEPLAALGVGLLQSADGGATWRLLAAPELLGAGVHDLLVDPWDGRRLLAATTAGLLASTDGGLGWERRLAGRSWAVSLGAGGELLAGGEHGLHRSGDGGTTWTRAALPAAPGGFDRVAVAHAAGGEVAYVFAAGDGVGHLWRREHGSGPFDPVKPPADLQSQRAWHDWVCAVDPADPDVVWLGAFGLHRGARGADGRWSWVDLASRPAGDSLPPAQHAVVFAPGDPASMYVANDGGLFRSPDGGRSWRSLGPGLAVAEVGHLAGHPDHDAWLLAEAGELGTLRYEGTEVWFQVDGGTRPSRGAVMRPPGGGDAERPVMVEGGLVAWGGDGMVAVSADGGASWTDVLLPEVRGPVTALAASRRTGLLAGTAEGEVVRMDLAGATWTVALVGRPRPGRLADLAVDPGRPEVVWAAWSDPRGGGCVWRSGDAGATWADRSDRLPAVPVSALALDPDRPDTVVAATDTGVWRSDDGGADWHPFGQGLPNTPALTLSLHQPDRLLRVGLLGRGVWEVALDRDREPAAAPYLRASRVEGGRRSQGTWWWQCPDIKVEAAPGQGDGPVGPVEFEDDREVGASGLPEAGGRVSPGQPARVHVQVHNRSGAPLPGVRVRVLAVPACLRPPDLPAGRWIMDGDPPPGSPWRAVGPAMPVGGLGPGRAGVVSFDWEVPGGMTRSVCLLAVAAADGEEVPVPTVDPAGLVAGDGRWGLKNLTVLTRTGAPPVPSVPSVGRRALRLDLSGPAGRGPFALAAEAWVHELAAGLVLGRELAGLARAAGLVPDRVGEPWRPELVALVEEDLSLAERLDLGAAFPVPEDRSPADRQVWLTGVRLAPDRSEPLILLLREPVPGSGSLLLLDVTGRVVGGHTLLAR